METVGDDSHLLDDLHLSSITVGQVMNDAARSLGVSVVQPPLNFATATVTELAGALDTLAAGAAHGAPEIVQGAEAWARPFTVDLDEVPLPVPPPAPPASRAGSGCVSRTRRTSWQARCATRSGTPGSAAACWCGSRRTARERTWNWR
ncbi:hypothetical protein ACFQHO_11015 [Actinomadura yumaensis]|uniref:hypothetical protein n=1 Tax=Actinomadura yumaensis TaxID=111807 RepID=UPI003620ADA9